MSSCALDVLLDRFAHKNLHTNTIKSIPMCLPFSIRRKYHRVTATYIVDAKSSASNETKRTAKKKLFDKEIGF